MLRTSVFVCLALAVLAGIACSSSGEGGRAVEINQNDDGCTPTTIEATPGEKLDLQVKNSTDNDYEVEGIEGTQLEEVVIPGGRDRSVGYNVPSEGGTYKIKCYVPGGTSTILEVHAGAGKSASASAAAAESGTAGANVSVQVGLIEFSVTPDVTSVDAGTIEFDAINNSKTMVHELAVLRVKEDGTFESIGEVEDLDPGHGGTMTLNLAAGKYQLACLIVPGEAGSTVDHYQQGMHTEFTVK